MHRRRRLHRRRRRLLRSWSIRSAGALTGALLWSAGAGTIGYVLANQTHAHAPSAAQAGRLEPTELRGVSSASPVHRLVLARSRPVFLSIPAINLKSPLVEVGLNANGTVADPSVLATPSEPAWYRNSPTPGALGPAVILGHVDSYDGPAVFFRLGTLRPGDRIDVRLKDGLTADFVVDGVREFAKASFPSSLVYGPTHFAALRLVTCGGTFDKATRSYSDNVVVFASFRGVPHKA